jgi:predicted RNase H-related nuclease YkuK (DUF458 family)
MLDQDWFTLDGDHVDIKRAIEETTQGDDKVVIIGTDSQRFEKREDFVTVIVVRTLMKGARVFYTREKDPKYYNLRDKLIKEAMLSIQTAWAISPILPDTCKLAALHADVNTDIKKGKSAKFESQIVGMIKGNGFEVITKPDGWAASHVSEHIVKNRHMRTWTSKQKSVHHVD